MSDDGSGRVSYCIRCDKMVERSGEGMTLTYNHETGAVATCVDCAVVVKRRNFLR